MRVAARFATIRRGVARLVALRHRTAQRAALKAIGRDMTRSVFRAVDLPGMISRLRVDGIATGLQMPRETVDKIMRYAVTAPCYADRMERLGFVVHERALAERALEKPILLAQYFNSTQACAAIDQLSKDPALLRIATEFIGAPARFVGANLWWTFPVQASDEDRDRHAHFFHRDVDDFRFLKFFFYVTDVPQNEGAHVCVRGSHHRPPILRTSDRWKLRRYRDAEIAHTYPEQDVLEICGPAGSGFADITLCVHKGRSPQSQPRLLLQLQYGLFDYGVMHDRRDPHQLARLDLAASR